MCLFEDLLEQNEGKTLEFKENTKSLTGLIKTIIAFANTSGGNLVIGVQDKTKKVIGLEDVLLEEERLASAIADSISPLLVPDIEIKTYAHKDVLIIRVPHIAGPCYLKSAGEHGGAYVRFGSTNRLADEATRVSLRLFSANLSYDETPQSLGKLDTALLKKIFQSVGKDPTEKKCEMLGILSSRLRKICAPPCSWLMRAAW